MKVGIFRPKTLPESFNVVIDNIVNYAPDNSIEFVTSSEASELHMVDVIWDPRAGGGHSPPDELLDLRKPLVVTLHGIGPLLFPKHYSSSFAHRLKVEKSNIVKKRRWKKAKTKCSKIVTVSEFSKRVINEELGIPLNSIDVIYNGVDLSTFVLEDSKSSKPPYFLHISNDESRKNVDLILEAYKNLPEKNKWPLILKLSSERKVDTAGVSVIKNRLEEFELADLYKNAGVFLFPSIYEGFGIPIIEAMAIGCPVITSKDTACEEIAGGFATLVAPSSSKQLMMAMEAAMNEKLRFDDKTKLRDHAATFSWSKPSQQYCALFKKVFEENEP